MYEFDRSTPVDVTLRAMSGVVEITAEDRLTIEVEVTPYDDGGSAAARDSADKTRVELDGDALLIQVPGADTWTWRRTPKLRITAKVPAGSTLTGKIAAADVRAAGVYASARLDAASAGLDVGEITGDADLDTASGDVKVARVGGDLTAKSSSGRLHIGDVSGDVRLRTASGNVLLRSAGGSVSAGTASGDIEIGRLSRGQAQVRTASGDVRVGLAAGTGVWMDLHTASGRTISDLTPHGGPAAPETDGPPLELRIRTASGDIHVHRAVAAGDAKAA
jgi:DUF4097 and DUF4098 domain-containing protein YvlB